MRNVLATLGLAFCLTLGGAALASTPTGPIGLEIEVQPVKNLEEAFVCKAKVVDLSSEALLAAPQVVFTATDRGETKTTRPDGTEVKLHVEVNPTSPDKLSYQVEVRSADAVLLARHLGSVRF